MSKSCRPRKTALLLLKPTDKYRSVFLVRFFLLVDFVRDKDVFTIFQVSRISMLVSTGKISTQTRVFFFIMWRKGSNYSIAGGFRDTSKSHVTKSWANVLFLQILHNILSYTKSGVFMEQSPYFLRTLTWSAYILPYSDPPRLAEFSGYVWFSLFVGLFLFFKWYIFKEYFVRLISQ